jgi:hypothetical protein
MKTRLFRIFSASFAVLTGLALAPMQAQAVNISIGVGGEVLPGVYGSVNIDNGRYPTLVYAEPDCDSSVTYFVTGVLACTSGTPEKMGSLLWSLRRMFTAGLFREVSRLLRLQPALH